MMRCPLILLAGVATLSVVSVRAIAQEERYETPAYTTESGPSLDKNYGLPSFGMPGAQMPRQKTMDPESRVPAQPDFFAKTPDYDVPKSPDPSLDTSAMETPVFTTPEGSTTDDTTTRRFTTGDADSLDGISGSDETAGSTPTTRR